MELSDSKIKKFLIFPEMEPCTFQPKLKNKKNPHRENFLYFRKRKPRKNFLYFLKRKLFLTFVKQTP